MKKLLLLATLLLLPSIAYAGPLQATRFTFRENPEGGPVDKFVLRLGEESGVYPIEHEITRTSPDIHSETLHLDVDKTYYATVVGVNSRGESPPVAEIVIPGRPAAPLDFSVESGE